MFELRLRCTPAFSTDAPERPGCLHKLFLTPGRAPAGAHKKKKKKKNSVSEGQKFSMFLSYAGAVGCPWTLSPDISCGPLMLQRETPVLRPYRAFFAFQLVLAWRRHHYVSTACAQKDSQEL